MRSVKSVLLLALVVGACSSDTTFGPESISGAWAEDFSIPGSFFAMTLGASGSTISGDGNWCGEAGPCGITTITGTINGLVVHLDFVVTPQFPQVGAARIEHFDGQLTSSHTLHGSISSEPSGNLPGPTGEISFHRL
jgi:hypothetical protein